MNRVSLRRLRFSRARARCVRRMSLLVSAAVSLLLALTVLPATAAVVSPQTVHVRLGPRLYTVNWTAVSGATRYDVEFIPHGPDGRRLFGPYLPHWTTSTTFSIPFSSLPSSKYGFETVVYSNVTKSPKPVRPKTTDYLFKTKVSNPDPDRGGDGEV